LAIPDEDGTLKLVDAGSGEVRLTLPGHGGVIADCAFSPDDRTLATVGVHDAEVRLWDTATGQQRASFRADAVGLRCLAFSPRCGLLAAGEDGGAVWVWDLATGERRGRLAGHDPRVCDLAFSADGRTLASCDGSPTLRLWDVPAQGSMPDAPRETVALPTGIQALAFAPSVRTLAVGQESGEVHLLGVAAGAPARRVGRPLLAGSGGAVRNLAFGADGRSLLVSRSGRPGDRHCLSVWDVVSGVRSASLGQSDLNAGRHAAAWMPDGRLLVQSAAGDVQIQALSAAPVRVLPHQALWPVCSLAFSPDGRSLYLGTADPLDGIRTSQRVPPLPFVAGDRRVVEDFRCQGDVADAVRVWDMERLTLGPRLPGEPSLALPEQIALSADGRLLAAGGPDGSVRLWDLAGRRLFARLFIGDQARTYANWVETWFALWPGKPEYLDNSEAVQALAFSPDHRWLAAAGARGTVTLWDTEGWQEHHPLPPAREGVAWVGFTCDSSLVVACKGQVRLCDPRTGEVRATLGAETDSPVLCGALSRDGRLLATGTAGQTVRVWDLASATERRALTGHMNQVAAVAFSPDGKTLASGDRSGTVKLWSVATLQEVASTEGHEGRVHCLAFSPDGQTLATGAETGPGKGEVFLWRAPRRQP
jgi:WD40 repeat protein